MTGGSLTHVDCVLSLRGRLHAEGIAKVTYRPEHLAERQLQPAAQVIHGYIGYVSFCALYIVQDGYKRSLFMLMPFYNLVQLLQIHELLPNAYGW
jgi:hypothetical protein